MTPTEHALALYRQGYKVFPLVPGGKIPAVKDWQKWATTATEAKIVKGEDGGYNWGVFCEASGLVVIDLDCKDADKNGLQSLKQMLNGSGPLPRTFSVRTPTGGLHLYYQGHGPNTAGRLGPGIDTRGTGGYVVAPGSLINNNAYSIESSAPVLPLPDVFVKALEGHGPKAISDDNPVIEGERNVTLASLAGSMRARGMNYEAIYAALTVVNDTQLESPLPDNEVATIAQSVARYKPEDAVAASDFIDPPKLWAMQASDIDPAAIKPRDWLMQNRLIGGHISVLVSPGGIGKSILSMLDALAVASGRPLTGFDVKAPAPVWVYNTEDPGDELKRRITALATHYQISKTDLSRVFVTSGREVPLILAKAGRDGIAINRKALEGVTDFIKSNGIKVLIVDPFVRTHEVNENDNMQIDKVVWCMQRIADRTGAAVQVVHHSRKTGPASKVDAESARGASALVNAARVAHVLQTMSDKEAVNYGVGAGQARWYMRLDNAKANLQPPANSAHWYKKISHTLMNGDDVGVVERVELVDRSAELQAEEFGANVADIAKALSEAYKATESGSFAVTDVLPRLAAYVPHLADCSVRWGRNRLIAALESGKCMAKGKIFSYEYDEKEYRKHRMIVSQADFLA